MKEKFNSFNGTGYALADILLANGDEFATFWTQNITGADAGLDGKF